MADYNSIDVFEYGKCNAYSRNTLIEGINTISKNCPLKTIESGGEITIGDIAIDLEFRESDTFYYLDLSGDGFAEVGEKIIKGNYYDNNGNLVKTAYTKEDGTIIVPQLTDLLPENRDYPVMEETLFVDETTGTTLEVGLDNVTHAIIQVSGRQALVDSSYNGNVDSTKRLGDLIRYSLLGLLPDKLNDEGYFANHGAIIKLESLSQILNFRAISMTDSVAFGSDIKPKLSITYYIGSVV